MYHKVLLIYLNLLTRISQVPSKIPGKRQWKMYSSTTSREYLATPITHEWTDSGYQNPGIAPGKDDMRKKRKVTTGPPDTLQAAV
jgi:hypothetical protein